jgi:hypothetical protein
MAITPPDRPLAHTNKWVMIYSSFSPARNPRYDFSEPYPFDNEAAAKTAAKRAKAANPAVTVLWAVAYPPVGVNAQPFVVDFQ